METIKIDKEYLFKTITCELKTILDLSSIEMTQTINILTSVFENIDCISSTNMLSTNVCSNDIIIKNFIGCKQLAGRSENSIEQYVRSVDKLIDYVKKDLLYITTNDIRRFLLYYQKSVSNTTADNCRRNLNLFFQFMEDENYIAKNPCKKISKIKEEIKYKRFYTDMEIEAMRDNCTNKKETALIDLLCSTGMRVSEVAKIRLSEIDFANRTIIVHGKGKKDRVVPFTVRCQKHLKEYIDERDYISPFLFSNIKKPNKNLSKCTIQQMVKRIGTRASLPNITVHCFRRWLASDLNRKGMDTTIIQEILGHSSFKTTQKHYLDSSTNRMQYMYNLLVS